MRAISSNCLKATSCAQTSTNGRRPNDCKSCLLFLPVRQTPSTAALRQTIATRGIIYVRTYSPNIILIKPGKVKRWSRSRVCTSRQRPSNLHLSPGAQAGLGNSRAGEASQAKFHREMLKSRFICELPQPYRTHLYENFLLTFEKFKTQARQLMAAAQLSLIKTPYLQRILTMHSSLRFRLHSRDCIFEHKIQLVKVTKPIKVNCSLYFF